MQVEVLSFLTTYHLQLTACLFLCLQLYRTFVLINDINAEKFVKEKKDKYAM